MFKARLWIPRELVLTLRESPVMHNKRIQKEMNALRNKVLLIGNLGQDPEVTENENGSKRARFSVATNETFRNTAGEKVTETQWHQVVAWGKLADIVANYLVKGKEVAVEGKLIHRQYDGEDGQRKYVTEVRCNELLLLGKQ